MLRDADVARAGVLRTLTALGLASSLACAQTASGPQPQQTPTPPASEATGATADAPPKPSIATSADGTPIAYDKAGSGPPLLLVHGGGQTRKSWNEQGYVERLQKQFTVITVDLRGTGDSGKPMQPDAYALDHVLADLLAVADAAGAPRFHVWGIGRGAAIARYLAARSDRVISAVLVGTTMGPAVAGVMKDAVEGMRKKWAPVVAAHAAGTLDPATLSASDRAAWDNGIALLVLPLAALLEYPPVEPAELKAPTLWLVGSDDAETMQNVKAYEEKLSGTPVTLKLLSSVSYSDSFIKSDAVLAEVQPFLARATGSP